MYFEQAYDAKRRWWLYLIGLVVVFFIGGWQIVGMIPLTVVALSKGATLYDFEDTNALSEIIGGNLFLALMLLSLALGLASIWVFIKTAHKRKFRSLISVGKTNYSKVFVSFFLTILFHGVFLLIGYLMNPELFVWNFNDSFWWVVLMGIFLLPFQTSCEEIVFRGYIMQWLGVWWNSKWLAIIVSSVIFGLLHGANNEVSEIGWSSMVFYIGFGLFMAIITTMDEGLELALGFHWATNFFAICLVSNDWGTAQTDSLIKDLSSPQDGSYMLYISTAALALMYLLFKAIYKWGAISKIFDRPQIKGSE